MTKAYSIQFLTLTLSAICSLSSMAYESYVVRSTDQPTIMEEQTYSQIEEGEEIRRQIKNNGYYHTYSENAATLLTLKSKKATALTEKDSDPYFRHLRMSPSEFQMTFPFKGISSVDSEHLLGFVPSGGLDDGYWTGVTAYFLDDHFGTCRLVVFDMPSYNAQSIYDPSYTTYDINGKPTTRGAEGSDASGFVYSTSWTGKRYEKQLECANRKPFDPQITQDLVAYAEKIDNDLPDEP